jgi:hypothetical protein
MTYDSVRQSEQLRILDHTIDDFVRRYNASSGPAGGGPRQTWFLFPGAMASKLKRAKDAWQPGVNGPQTFDYETSWLTPISFLGGAQDLRLTRVAAGDYRDQDEHIVIADGVINLLMVAPYVDFTAWCSAKGIDWYIVPWDWRRAVNDAGKFFLNKFLPHFRQRVQSECFADPLADCSIIGHSAGGMVVNWVLRKNDPSLANLRAAITVATPFYGYGGQLHRWFEGEELLNGPLNVWRKGIIKAICSFPGCYAWHFIPKARYEADKAVLAADAYPLASYPSADAAYPATIADPYNPIDQGSKKRYPSFSTSGFDKAELARGKRLVNALAKSLPPALAQKFYCIRGVTNSYTTLSETTWGFLPPPPPTPIKDVTVAAGDTSLPAWTARHVGLPPGHVGTVVGNDVEHMKIMDSSKTIQLIATILSIPYP